MAANKKLATRALWKMWRPRRSAIASRRPAIAASEKPATWAQWKARHSRWPHLTGIEWVLEWLVYRCRNLAIFEVLEFAGRASVLVAVFVWFWEADDRKKQSHYRAWELINSARESTGDGGRRDALQDLNEDKVNLSAAPLANAYMVEVQLPNANMSGAGLSEAHLSGANLSEANLTKADLTKADLSEANLTRANLSEANLTLADLSEAHLSGAKLPGAHLSGANLTKADLSEAHLSGADLPGANLTRANLRWTHLPGADLRSVHLSMADLRGADLSEARLSGADLRRANLSWAKLPGADLRWEANLTRIARADGHRSEADLRDADLTGADLTGALFCHTTMPDGTVNNQDCPPETQPAPPSPGEETSAPK
jgi:uncharacterized protein YjbI with pentapeptide repeats